MILLVLLVGRNGFEPSTNGLKVRVVDFNRLILLIFLPQIPLQFAQQYATLHHSSPQIVHKNRYASFEPTNCSQKYQLLY
jgi:hypothetical protein